MSEDLPLSTRILLEHYDQGVVMRLLHSSGIFFKEKYVPICSSLFRGGYSVDSIHLPLIWLLEGFDWPFCGWPAYDRLYLLDHAWWILGRTVLIPWWGFTLVLVILLRPTRFSILHKPLQFPFFIWAPLFLLLQVFAIFCVMVVIIVEMTILLLIMHVG